MADVDVNDQDEELQPNTQMPPELVAALMGGQAAPGGEPGQPAAQAPTGASPGGLMGALVAPRQATGQPSIANPPQAAAASPAPSPSDDPALSMPAVPKPPDLSNSALAQLLTKTQKDQEALAAVPKVDPAANRPRLWERLLGFAAGTAAGLKDPELGYRAASGVTNRRLSRAQSDYDVRTGPLLQALQQDREGLGLAEAQTKIPQQNFENQLQASREGREQSTASGRIRQYTARADELKGKFVAGSEQKDDNSPTGWTAETFDGDRKPFTPKSATNTPKTPAGEFSGWYEAFSRDNGRPPNAKEVSQHEISLKQAERPPKDSSPNGYTPDEQREIGSRSRRFQTRIDSLEKQRGDYLGSKRPADVQTLKSIDDEIEQNHQKIDEVEQDVMGRRAQKPGAGGKPAAGKPAAGGQSTGLGPRQRGQELTDQGIAKKYLQKADGDTKKAQQMAENDGWVVPVRKGSK